MGIRCARNWVDPGCSHLTQVAQRVHPVSGGAAAINGLTPVRLPSARAGRGSHRVLPRGRGLSADNPDYSMHRTARGSSGGEAAGSVVRLADVPHDQLGSSRFWPMLACTSPFLTFSPVKSVSTLWAVAEPAVAAAIERAPPGRR
jgi:hypothetical protein